MSEVQESPYKRKRNKMVEWALMLVVIVIVFGSCIVSNQSSAQADASIIENQIAACERGNTLRESFNERGQVLYGVLDEFITIAAETREASATHADSLPEQVNIDLATAALYRELIAQLETSYEAVPLIDCNALFNAAPET